MPSLPLPYTLANGTLADAAQVMADFNTLLNAINDGHITTLGTVTSGTWQGGPINLTYGGTNADLSATGPGVLRQATLGASVTVGSVSTSDISGLATVATSGSASDLASGTLPNARLGISTAQLSDYRSPATWTPTDGSGAGLSFTVTDARYVRIGKLAVVSAVIKWPATVNGADAKIAGLPVTSFAGSDAVGGGSPSSVIGLSPNSVLLSVASNATTFTVQGAGGGAFTNANLSGATIRFTIMYITA